MNLNEKVEQLVEITAALKNEVNELKGNDVNAKLFELEDENKSLKDDILELKRALMQQHENILSLIKLQNDQLVGIIEADKLAPQFVFSRKMSEYSKLFPIKSLPELDKLEEIISDNNIDELAAIVRPLLQPKGIIKNISLVMSVPCIMKCNVDGHYNKRRLLNSPKFMDLVFRAAYDEGCSQKTFLDEFRRGFKMVKNRYNQNLCRHRQIQRQREEQAEIQVFEVEDVLILPDIVIKTEETEQMYYE